jgi:hypothetical protein
MKLTHERINQSLKTIYLCLAIAKALGVLSPAEHPRPPADNPPAHSPRLWTSIGQNATKGA